MPRSAFIPAPEPPSDRTVIHVAQAPTQEPPRASGAITTVAFLAVVLLIAGLGYMAISEGRTERSQDITQAKNEIAYVESEHADAAPISVSLDTMPAIHLVDNEGATFDIDPQQADCDTGTRWASDRPSVDLVPCQVALDPATSYHAQQSVSIVVHVNWMTGEYEECDVRWSMSDVPLVSVPCGGATPLHPDAEVIDVPGEEEDVYWEAQP